MESKLTKNEQGLCRTFGVGLARSIRRHEGAALSEEYVRAPAGRLYDFERGPARYRPAILAETWRAYCEEKEGG